jgi:hypothetical protein
LIYDFWCLEFGLAMNFIENQTLRKTANFTPLRCGEAQRSEDWIAQRFSV